MDLRDLLSIAFASLIVLVVAHFAVYWVVKTLYPPAPVPIPIALPAQAPVSVPERVPVVSFTEPPATEQQNVSIPTYETPVPAEGRREEGERRGPPPAESTSIRGESRPSPANT